MFSHYKCLIVFALDGIKEPFKVGDVIMLPDLFAEDLVKAGSVEKVAQ